MNQISFVIVSVLLCAAWAQDENKAREFITEGYKKCAEFGHKINDKKWAAATAENADERNQRQKEVNDENAEYDKYFKGTYEEYKSYKDQWKSFNDEHLKRMFFLWSDYGTSLLQPEDEGKVTQLQADMKKTVEDAKIKEFGSNEAKLTNADVTNKMKSDISNSEETKFYWLESHNVAKPLKDQFKQWIDLENQMAKLNDYDNLVKYWESRYEVDDYENTMVPLLDSIMPLFKELHAYIRQKLREEYKNDDNIIRADGAIPANLLGWKWGLDASPLADRIRPFPNAQKPDIDEKIKTLTGRAMVESVDGFFQSLGFEKLPEEFYTESVLEKKGDMDCTGNTFNDDPKYRMKVCVQPTVASYADVIKNVAFTEYSLAYKGQEAPFFRQPPGIPFGNAYLSLMTRFANAPGYLKSANLLDQGFQLDHDQIINALFGQALTWVFFLPFGLSYDMFRWHVAEGKHGPENCKYWELVTKYQGVEPPVKRGNDDFDFGVRAWGLNGGQYMMYFMSKFMEYDIVRELCKTAEYYDPQKKPDNALVFCDISNNKAAGGKLKEALALGNSQPWHEVLKKITGHDKLDASALMEYFKPLQDWLQEQNNSKNVKTGWNENNDKCQ